MAMEQHRKDNALKGRRAVGLIELIERGSEQSGRAVSGVSASETVAATGYSRLGVPGSLVGVHTVLGGNVRRRPCSTAGASAGA